MARKGRTGWDKLSPREVRKRGKQDGRKWRWQFFPPSWPPWFKKGEDPPLDQKTCSGYEGKLIDQAHREIQGVVEEWEGADKPLKDEYCVAKRDHDELIERYKKEAEEHKDVIEPFEEAKRNYFKYPPAFLRPWAVYWGVVFVIICAEGIFNAFVFLQFGVSSWESYLMAAGIILIIPIAAEISGHYIKKEEQNIRDKVFVIVCIVVVLGVLSGLGFLRELFFESENQKADSLFKLAAKPTTIAMILIVFNIAIFVVLIFFAYAQSQKDPEGYRKAKREYLDAKKILEKEGGDVEAVAEKLANAKVRLERAYNNRVSTFKQFGSDAEGVKKTWIVSIRDYRHANMAAREKSTLPESFKADPKDFIKISPVFDNLDWDCSETLHKLGKNEMEFIKT